MTRTLSQSCFSFGGETVKDSTCTSQTIGLAHAIRYTALNTLDRTKLKKKTTMEMTTTHNHSDVPEIGFYEWLGDIIHSTTGLPIMVLVIFVSAVLSEALSAAIKRLRARPLFWIRSRRMTAALHNLLSTAAHTGKVALMFMLMVVFMALDTWLCVAAVLGAAVGHLMFNWSFVWESEAPDKEDMARSQW